MTFNIHVTPGPQHTRVALTGQANMGQLLSLLQVLQVDSAGWPSDTVLLDLSELEAGLSQADRTRFQQEAISQLPRMQCISVRWNPMA